MAGAITFRVRIDGVRETLAALAALPRDADDELRDRAGQVSTMLAAKIAAAGTADGKQSRRAAKTVTAGPRDRLPSVTAGPHPLLLGSEFGMTRKSGWYRKPRYFESAGRQFRVHLGRGSYWFFRTADAAQPEVARQWRAAADEIAERFGRRAAG